MLTASSRQDRTSCESEMKNQECIFCVHLGGCTKTDEAKVLAHFVCEVFQEESQDEVIRARLDVINKFGSAGVRSVISPEAQKEE
jgi:hypothetical protein